jgi:protein TonB
MTSQNSKKNYLPLLLLLLIVVLGLGYFFFIKEKPKTEELVKNEDTTTVLKEEVIKQVIDTVAEKVEEQVEKVTEEQVDETKKAENTQVKKEEENPVQKKEVKKEEVEEIVIADTEPQPVGGYAAFYQYVRKNLYYPEAAKEEDIQGQVQVRFQVLKDGSIGKAKILKGIGGGCDQEALRVIRTGIKWTPAQIGGKNIDYYTVVPIVFKLAHVKKEEK